LATILKLSEELASRIRAHAADSYPYECCGALLGRDGGAVREVHDLIRLANRREDSPQNRYVIHPEDVRAAEGAARERGLELVGWYHSHPDSPARPSQYDREHAWPWYSYVIVSVEPAGARDMASWRLIDDRTGFELEGIEADPESEHPVFPARQSEERA
jgi:proteasome lid subunit RPN8/RPN11